MEFNEICFCNLPNDSRVLQRREIFGDIGNKEFESIERASRQMTIVSPYECNRFALL